MFSTSLLPRVSYAHALNDYLQNRLKVGHFRVVDEEFGVIPMTDLPFPRRLGRRIMAIGTRGGRVKPSTGYAFSRIQRDSQAIVRSLLATGNPYHIPSDSLRHRFYDILMLEVMAEQSDRVRGDIERHVQAQPDPACPALPGRPLRSRRRSGFDSLVTGSTFSKSIESADLQVLDSTTLKYCAIFLCKRKMPWIPRALSTRFQIKGCCSSPRSCRSTSS